MDARKNAIAVLLHNAEKWPASFVPRKDIEKFTGYLYSPGYLANLDSRGMGPRGSFHIGRQIVYPVGLLTEWLINKIEA